jgi:uncharacterized protein (TIGR02302 family)
MSAARDPLPRHLDRGRRLARMALVWEALWPRLWPALGVIGLFLAVALSGLLLKLPPLPHLLVLAAFLLAVAFAAWRGFRGFALPGAAAAERRLEADSGLSHRPLATLRDRPATEDPMALALWQAHRSRALAALKTLRVRHPRPGLPARDPRALRAAVLLALAAALVMAGPEAPERLRRALVPGFGAPAALPALKLEAWITPPVYTGAAPIFLDPAGGSLTVPQGSRLQVALSGGAVRDGVPELLIDAAATPFRSLDAASFAIEAALGAGSRIAIRRDGRELAQWTFAVQPDSPPTAAFSDTPGRAARGGLAIRLPWRAEDDWGVAGAQAELRLEGRPEAAPLLVPLPLPGGTPKQPQGVAQPDLTAHPWAGLPVTIRILARDGAGQEGASAPQGLVLPERPFNHPVARALVALRRDLSRSPGAREPVWRGLDALAASPDAFENDVTTYLAMRIARQRLRRDPRPEAVAEAQEVMWQAALALEEGRADRTRRALAEAREALREALAEAERTPPDAQGRAELERRVQELREAIQQHLQALAERLQQENAEAQPNESGQRLMDQRQIDGRTEAMREAAKEGRTDRMQQELAELEKMLDALQQGRVARQEGGNNRRQQQQRERGQQQMGVVQDMVRRQGEMLDRSHQRGDSEDQRGAQDRRPGNQRPRPQPGQQPGQQQPGQQQQGQQQSQQPAAEAQRDARQQRALRRALGELMQQFGDLTGEIPEPLGRADQAMRQAQEALSRGGDPRAAQQQAIRELQEGGRQMAQSMQRQFGQGQEQGEGEGEGPGEGQASPGTAQGGPGQERGAEQAQGRDPLGRHTQDAPGANEQGSDTQIPGEAELLRSRRIQEELRRRGGERERPPGELDYIDRLLKTF